MSSLCHKIGAGKFSFLPCSGYTGKNITCSSNILPVLSQVVRLNLLSVVADNHNDPEALSISAQNVQLLNDLGINKDLHKLPTRSIRCYLVFGF